MSPCQLKAAAPFALQAELCTAAMSAYARPPTAVWGGAQHDETVKSVAEKLGKNPAAVLVRWAVQHGTSGALTVSLSPFWSLDAAWIQRCQNSVL